jgi:hypothetical protein
MSGEAIRSLSFGLSTRLRLREVGSDSLRSVESFGELSWIDAMGSFERLLRLIRGRPI